MPISVFTTLDLPDLKREAAFAAQEGFTETQVCNHLTRKIGAGLDFRPCFPFDPQHGPLHQSRLVFPKAGVKR